LVFGEDEDLKVLGFGEQLLDVVGDVGDVHVLEAELYDLLDGPFFLDPFLDFFEKLGSHPIAIDIKFI